MKTFRQYLAEDSKQWAIMKIVGFTSPKHEPANVGQYLLADDQGENLKAVDRSTAIKSGGWPYSNKEEQDWMQDRTNLFQDQTGWKLKIELI